MKLPILAFLLISCAHLSHGVSPRVASLLQSTVQAKGIPEPENVGVWFEDPKASGEVIIAGAAAAAGMTEEVIVFNQVEFGAASGAAGDNQAICYGLAALFCNDRASGNSDSDFISAVKDLETSPYYSKAGLIWKNQKDPSIWMKLVPKLASATGDEKVRSAAFKALDRGSLEETPDKKALQTGMETYEWFQWVKKHGDRVFMISLEGARHEVALAFVGGKFSFFDPNTGIATGNELQMHKFLYYYFNAARINKSYAKASHVKGAVLTEATRYKKNK